MNEIITNFFLARDNFMPEMLLKQPDITYSAFGPFIKRKERIKITLNLRYIYQNELQSVS